MDYLLGSIEGLDTNITEMKDCQCCYHVSWLGTVVGSDCQRKTLLHRCDYNLDYCVSSYSIAFRQLKAKTHLLFPPAA